MIQSSLLINERKKLHYIDDNNNKLYIFKPNTSLVYISMWYTSIKRKYITEIFFKIENKNIGCL